MQIIYSLSDLRSARQEWRASNATVAFVPTMGNLHRGHLNLVKAAKRMASHVVVSIFVNPMQFGANEDLDKYPRTFEADCKALEELGVSAVFAPTPAIMYPNGLAQQTSVEVPGISNVLCGESRPGHFKGVATVVCKLFNMVEPQFSIFGEKDFQQLQVIRQMVADLSINTEVIGIATERADDGLALSSRNQYLNTEQRAVAPIIYQTMTQSCQAIVEQTLSPDQAQSHIERILTEHGFEIDYVAICDVDSLQSITQETQQGVILIAAFLGTTRLIDNHRFTLSAK